MVEYMLDGNVIDYLIDNNVDLDRARAVGTLYIASVQRSELINVPDDRRRVSLAVALDQLAPTMIPVATPVWLDDMHWDDDSVWRDNPTEIESAIYGNSENANRWKDAAIGGLAHENGYILVTLDGPFRKRAEKVGLKSTSPKDLFGE